mgnify:CR=1 FL=1
MPDEYGSSIRKNLQLKFKISFNWLSGKKFTSDKLWGKIELVTPPDKEEYFSSEQKKQFLGLMQIDLKIETTEGVENILSNIKCNQYGEFEILSNQQDIQKALEDNKIRCFLKLIFY